MQYFFDTKNATDKEMGLSDSLNVSALFNIMQYVRKNERLTHELLFNNTILISKTGR